MKQDYIEILKIVVPVIGTIIVAIVAYTIKNKNTVKNNNSNNITNSSNNKIQGNNYGINNKIDK